MFPGIGTVVNVATVLVGSSLGVLLGNRLALRTRELVTDALGLVTLLVAGTSAMAVLDDSLEEYVGGNAPTLDHAGLAAGRRDRRVAAGRRPGRLLSEVHLAAITATGGLPLVGVALRLLKLREIAVADLLPALLVAPDLVAVVGSLR